jgi:hypothetical protein
MQSSKGAAHSAPSRPRRLCACAEKISFLHPAPPLLCRKDILFALAGIETCDVFFMPMRTRWKNREDRAKLYIFRAFSWMRR